MYKSGYMIWKRLVRTAVATAFIALTISSGMPLINHDLNIVSAAPASQKASINTIHFKLASTVKLQGQTFIGTPADQVAKLNDTLASAGKTSIRKMVAHADKTDVQSKVSQKLSGYYVVTVKNGNMVALATQLKSLSVVSEAYAAPVAVPSPLSANYTNLQTYLQASPKGIDTGYAQSVLGGNGSAVRIIDIEYSWNINHEDLSKARTALLANGTPVDPFNDNNHGTAVLGELVADNNAYGVTGAANGANLTLINANNAEYGYDPVAALHLAASQAKAGDVVLIEQQTYGPNGKYAPIEWIPAVYDAISALTANGVTVIEPAANGSENLDSSIYGSSFPAGKADSGAIMVGAGEACTDTGRLSRLSSSNYGSRVNLQGPGNCVVTSGYGGLGSTKVNSYYTNGFNGTSSASSVVAAAAASISSANKSVNSVALTPVQIRATLVSTGTAQNLAAGQLSGNIGPQPNLAQALASLKLTDTVAPTTPTGLTATSMKGKTYSNKLTWTAATDTVGVTGYHVYRNGVLLASVTTTNFTDSSVPPRTTYSYQVAAYDAAGNVSELSAAASVTSGR